jgi:hypothetical protein
MSVHFEYVYDTCDDHSLLNRRFTPSCRPLYFPQPIVRDEDRLSYAGLTRTLSTTAGRPPTI